MKKVWDSFWGNKAAVAAVAAGLLAAGHALNGDYSQAMTALVAALGFLGIHLDT